MVLDQKWGPDIVILQNMKENNIKYSLGSIFKIKLTTGKEPKVFYKLFSSIILG